MKKIYISGQITGLSENVYMYKFEQAEKELKEKGYSVINPAKVNAQMPIDTSYEEYMAMSRTMLEQADTIYMLDNWEKSKGAQKEREWAYETDMNIIYQ